MVNSVLKVLVECSRLDRKASLGKALQMEEHLKNEYLRGWWIGIVFVGQKESCQWEEKLRQHSLCKQVFGWMNILGKSMVPNDYNKFEALAPSEVSLEKLVLCVQVTEYQVVFGQCPVKLRFQVNHWICLLENFSC